MPMKSLSYYGKWKWIAPVGLMLIGLGFSLAGQGIILKAGTGPAWEWVAIGTLGLVSLNAGISIFGEAVVRRVHWERKKEQGFPETEKP